MKAIIIQSAQSKTFTKSLIDELPEDGSFTIEIKKTDKSPTGKQRRLQWLWATEVANSGIGGNDTKEGVHLAMKWKFARPILLRDCDVFPVFYFHFEEVTKYAEEKSHLMKEFTRLYISAENLSKTQRAEYLTDFQRFWVGKGVCLTDPSLQGLNPDTFL